MNILDLRCDSDHEATGNAVNLCSLSKPDSVIDTMNQSSSNKSNSNETIGRDSTHCSSTTSSVCVVGEIDKNDDSMDDVGEVVSGAKGEELVPSVEQEEERENHHFSFFLENDSSLVSDETSKAPPLSCSSSSSSTIETHFSSTSTDDNSSDDDGVKNKFSVDDILQTRMITTRKLVWGGPSKDASEYAIARSRIATEAANEALRRQSIRGFCHQSSGKLDLNRYVISSVGRGSSAADAIHENDQRPIWQQGYNSDNDNDRDDASGKHVDKNAPKVIITAAPKMHYQSPILSIAQQAAAVGLLKQQNRKRHNQQQPSKKNDVPTSGTNCVDSNGKTKTVGSYGNDDGKFIDGKKRGEAVLCSVNDPDNHNIDRNIAKNIKNDSMISQLSCNPSPESQSANENIDNVCVDDKVMSKTRFTLPDDAETRPTRDENISELSVDVDVDTDHVIADIDEKLHMDVDETVTSIRIEEGEKPRSKLDIPNNGLGHSIDGQATKRNDPSQEEKHFEHDSSGDTSTIAPAKKDITIATSKTTQVFFNFALTIGRISWNLKRIRRKKVSAVDEK